MKKDNNKEINNLEWWIPSWRSGKKMITANEAFAQFSERGIKPDFSSIKDPERYHELMEAKKWRKIQLNMWQEGVLAGSVPYWTLLGGENPKEILPRNVVNFMKKEMFKGMDREIIESCYQKVLRHWTWWRKLLNRMKI